MIGSAAAPPGAVVSMEEEVLRWTKVWAAGHDMEALAVWNPLPLDLPLITRAFAVQHRGQISWWDAMIVAAADATGCTRILSEDLADQASYFGILVENPFKTAP